MSKTYGVEDLAKLAGVEVASARVMLRKVGAKKKGKVYEFAGKEEMQKIIDKSRAGKGKTEKKAAKKSKKTAKKPAKKPSKKPAKEETAGAEA